MRVPLPSKADAQRLRELVQSASSYQSQLWHRLYATCSGGTFSVLACILGVQVLVFMLRFREMAAHCAALAGTLVKACQQVKGCRLLLLVVAAALHAGNELNQGSTRGEQGERKRPLLSSLLRLMTLASPFDSDP